MTIFCIAFIAGIIDKKIKHRWYFFHVAFQLWSHCVPYIPNCFELNIFNYNEQQLDKQLASLAAH